MQIYPPEYYDRPDVQFRDAYEQWNDIEYGEDATSEDEREEAKRRLRDTFEAWFKTL